MSIAEPDAGHAALRAEKKALRARILASRDRLDPAIRLKHSRIITEKLLALPTYRDAGTVSAYASIGSEFDTSAFVAAILAAGKRLLLPRINRAARALELRLVGNPATDLVAGVWGIREPSDKCALVPASDVGFVLVPGVAFTASGERIGYGGGFYDRLLAELDPAVPRIAAAFDLQLVDSLPTGSQDQRVHRVVTEVGDGDGRRVMGDE